VYRDDPTYSDKTRRLIGVVACDHVTNPSEDRKGATFTVVKAPIYLGRRPVLPDQHFPSQYVVSFREILYPQSRSSRHPPTLGFSTPQMRPIVANVLPILTVYTIRAGAWPMSTCGDWVGGDGR